MVKHALTYLLALVIALAASAAAWSADPIAAVDRGIITIEDTFTLTIRVADGGSYNSPDTSVLEKDFHLLGTSQSSRHSIVNGHSESSTEWKISLAPKRPGKLQIPPIEVGDKMTQALTVVVRPAQQRSAASDEPVFVESEISDKKLYVQQQLLFTVRIFQSIQLDNMSLSDIEIDNALIEKLDQNSFQRRINGRIYRVHEVSYAIFPQQAGELTIPEVVFSANELVSQRSVFSLPGQGPPVRRLTRQHQLTVLEPPAAYAASANRPWLPAKDIQLLESWSGNPDDIRVGDSITRTITIKARGLLGSQLPPIRFEETPGVRFYPDQGEVENTLSAQGASAIRTDSSALIPTRDGKLELPAITLKWWDTDEQRLKTATIAARTLNVKPAPAGAGATASGVTVDHSQPLQAPAPATASQPSSAGLWQLTTLLFACLWVVTGWLWWQARQSGPQRPEAATDAAAKPNERRLFAALEAACRSEDPQRIRRALIDWAQAFWPEQTIHALSDIAACSRHPTLNKQIKGLDATLYGSTRSAANAADWRDDALLKTLKIVRKTLSGDRQQRPASLPPLYPESSSG